MSIRLKVHDDRLVLDLDRTSAHIELPLRQDDEPLVTDFSPGLPVHVEQDTNAKVFLYDGWLFVGTKPLMPIGPEGSLGDGITIVRHCIDSRARDDDVFPGEREFADAHDRHATRQTIQGYRP